MPKGIFHERLKECIAETGESQKDIAAKLNLTPQAFSYYVNGREPSYEVLGDMSILFGKSTDYLLGLKDFTSTEMESIHTDLGLDERAVLNIQAYSGAQKGALSRFFTCGKTGAIFEVFGRAIDAKHIEVSYKLSLELSEMLGDIAAEHIWQSLYDGEEQRLISAFKVVLENCIKPLYNDTILPKGGPEDGEHIQGGEEKQ